MTWEGLNRRQFPRAKFPCLLKVIMSGNIMDAILTHSENISIGGVCVILKISLERFAPVDIELDMLDGEDHIVCKGRVMWVVRRRAGEALKPSFYDVGLEFLDIKDNDRARVRSIVERLAKAEQKAIL